MACMVYQLGILAGVFLAAVSPLTEEQSQRLSGATDRSATFDEAAFYALLENAGAWEPTLAGATVPDYSDLYAASADHRGRYLLIEGKLTCEWVLPRLARAGWEDVRAFLIEYQPDRQLLVFLAHPPDVTRLEQLRGNYRLAEQGMKVKLGARFFKTIKLTNEQTAQAQEYLVFVGHSINEMQEVDRSGGIKGMAVALPIVLIIALLVTYMMLRRSSSNKESRIDKFHRERAMRRAAESGALPSKDEPEDETPTDLPDDPATALHTLDETNRET